MDRMTNEVDNLVRSRFFQLKRREGSLVQIQPPQLISDPITLVLGPFLFYRNVFIFTVFDADKMPSMPGFDKSATTKTLF